MDDPDGWAHRLATISVAGGDRAQRICEMCVSDLGITGAGISMVTALGNRGVVCATDDTAARIEDLQFTLGEGPCIDAARWGSPVLVPDLCRPGDIAVDRWPVFMSGASAAGVRAVFAFPLRIGAINVGALDLYRDAPGDLSASQLRASLVAAVAAATALIADGNGSSDTFAGDAGIRSNYQLHVHQATGMVQVQLGVDTEEAFVRLRARAFALGRPLQSVAIDVVERRLRFSLEDE